MVRPLPFPFEAPEEELDASTLLESTVESKDLRSGRTMRDRPPRKESRRGFGELEAIPG